MASKFGPKMAQGYVAKVIAYRSMDIHGPAANLKVGWHAFKIQRVQARSRLQAGGVGGMGSAGLLLRILN